MAVQTNPKQHQIKPLPNRGFVILANLFQLGRIDIDAVKVFFWQIDMIEQVSPEHVRAAALIIASQAAKLIERENLRVPEGDFAAFNRPGHGGIDLVWGMA